MGSHVSLLEFLEGRKSGRLLCYDPATGKTTVLITDLFFGNGVAVSKDGKFVLVNSTFNKKIFRYWIAGPEKGTHELFADTLPGHIDGISLGSNGNFWVALMNHDRGALTPLLGKFPSIRPFIAKFFRQVLPHVVPKLGAVLELNQDGEVVRGLYDPKGEKIHSITSVIEHNGKLYLGGFRNFIGVKTLVANHENF